MPPMDRPSSPPRRDHWPAARATFELEPPPPPACPACGYDLRGLVSLSGARCPECGSIEPFDRLHFGRGRRSDVLVRVAAGPGRRAVRRAGAPILVVVVVLLAVVLTVGPLAAPAGSLARVAMTLGAAVVAAGAVAASVRRLGAFRPTWHDRALLTAGALPAVCLVALHWPVGLALVAGWPLVVRGADRLGRAWAGR